MNDVEVCAENVHLADLAKKMLLGIISDPVASDERGRLVAECD